MISLKPLDCYDDVEGIAWMVVVVGVDFIAGVIVCKKTIKMKMKFINVGIFV